MEDVLSSERFFRKSGFNQSIEEVVDQFILWCSNFDPDSNSYVPQAWIIMKLCGAATVGLVLACLAPYWIGRRGQPADPGLDAKPMNAN